MNLPIPEQRARECIADARRAQQNVIRHQAELAECDPHSPTAIALRQAIAHDKCDEANFRRAARLERELMEKGVLS